MLYTYNPMLNAMVECRLATTRMLNLHQQGCSKDCPQRLHAEQRDRDATQALRDLNPRHLDPDLHERLWDSVDEVIDAHPSHPTEQYQGDPDIEASLERWRTKAFHRELETKLIAAKGVHQYIPPKVDTHTEEVYTTENVMQSILEGLVTMNTLARFGQPFACLTNRVEVRIAKTTDGYMLAITSPDGSLPLKRITWPNGRARYIPSLDQAQAMAEKALAPRL